MHDNNTLKPSLWAQLQLYIKPPVINMLFLGFSAGLPILLIFSSLSLWLREADVSRSMVTYFSWAALGYSFKFVWAPLVDKLPLPILSQLLGRRRAWLLLAQLAVIGAIVAMAMTDPKQGKQALTIMAIAAVALGFSSATQDVVIDAYRIEVADVDLQALMSATYIAGYRIAMIAAGAGALFLAAEWGSSSEIYSYIAWQKSYLAMAALMLIGVKTTLFISEPTVQREQEDYQASDYMRFLLMFLCLVGILVAVYVGMGDTSAQLKASAQALFDNKALSGLLSETLRLGSALFMVFVGAWLLLKVNLANQTMVKQAYAAPVLDFFDRYGLKLALLLLALIGFYRISDIVLGVISNLFYQDMGFSKKEIAGVVKTFGVVMTIFGGFAGGMVAIRYGVMKALFIGAILSALTNILFMLLPRVLEMPGVQAYVLQFNYVYPAWGLSLALALMLIGAALKHSLSKIDPSQATQNLRTKIYILLAESWGGLVLLIAAVLLGYLSIDAFMFKAASANITGSILSLGTVIAADNLSAGLASAAFIAFLSSLTNVSFTATQYAIFSSLMTLLPKIIGGYSGSMVDAMGYEKFFLITTLMGIPVLLLVYLAGKHLSVHSSK